MGSRVIAKPLGRVDIREIVNRLKGILQVSDQLCIDVVRVLEFALPEFGIDFEIVETEKMEKEALTFPDERKILIREDVYYGAIRGNGRDRFTIMHELGHVVLHGKYAISYARGDKQIEAFKDPEWQADAFAGEFLIPKHLTENMSPEKISQVCKVSISAARYQAKK